MSLHVATEEETNIFYGAEGQGIMRKSRCFNYKSLATRMRNSWLPLSQSSLKHKYIYGDDDFTGAF